MPSAFALMSTSAFSIAPIACCVDAARCHPPHRLHQRDVRLDRARVLADQHRREPLDDLGHAQPAEALVVLAPADQSLVGRDLQEIERPPAAVGVQRLNRRDLHSCLLARAPPGLDPPPRTVPKNVG